MQGDGEALELQCPICYGESAQGVYATLWCGHVYHEECLARALQHKKECPTCRQPAKVAGTKIKCPCQTGKPIKLFHLKHRGGAGGASPLPGGVGGGAAAAGGEPGVDAAVLAAAKQRAERLREALDEERQRGAELERTLVLQVEETSRALEKAERRKQRLAALEHEHKLAAARLESERIRLEARVKWLEEEAAARAKSLQGLRMEVAKLRSDLGDKDQHLMRARREAANCRARLGTAPPTAAELMELAGDDKVSWAQVYSITVEERNRALEEARRLQEAVAKGRLETETRAAAERLAGEERVKERDAELDRRRRELMQLEYKLHELQAQLAEAQRQGSGSQSLTPVPTQPAALAAPPRQLQQQQQQQHGPRARPAALPPSAAPRHQHLAEPTAGKPQVASRSSAAWQQPRQQAAGAAAAAETVAPGQSGGGGGGGVHLLGDKNQAKLLLAQMEAQSAWALERGACTGGRASGRGEDDDDDDDEGLATLADFCGEEEEEAEAEEQEEEEAEPEQEQEMQPCQGPWGAEADVKQVVAQAGAVLGGEDPILLVDEDCGGSVPALPRAVCGLFAGGGGGGGGGGGSGGGGVGGGSRAAGGKAVATGAARTAATAGVASTVPSFAKKAAGVGVFGGSRLIGEGPDGRGGTTRFPLTSSFAMNQLQSKSSGTKGGKGRGKGSGATGAAGRQGVGAAGRIDAFLKRVVPAGPGPR